MEHDKWYRKAMLRNVVDMHITDLDDSFMSRLDPDQYAEHLSSSHSESAVVYAQSHVGLCYYLTKVGEAHRGMSGRDYFRELVDACHTRKIGVVAYYSVIFNSWAYNRHPEWRIIDGSGKETATPSRYGLCCPNSPYRDFVREQILEICSGYDFEGVRFDMTFWPAVCYCGWCRDRFAEEVGGGLPRTVDWYDRTWVAFQRARERWLIEFAELCTSTAHAAKPGVSVEHQASTFAHSWRNGVTFGLSAQNDFLQGDFYGDKLQGSFACKQFYNLSADLPFGFETSSSVELADHTTMKSTELLTAKMFAAVANGGAFVFIDAVDPVGTMNPAVYERLGGVFSRFAPYRGEIGGELCQDIGIYLSTESKFSFSENGKSVVDSTVGSDLPHIRAALGVARACIHHNLPYGVITKRNIGELKRFNTIVLPNVLMMDDDEVAAIREYVAEGGSIYASKHTSLLKKNGDLQTDFMLGDVLGVSFLGETKEKVTYIAPCEGDTALASHCTKDHPLCVRESQIKVAARPQSVVLGTLVLPFTDPSDKSRYASIHSNPPGIATKHPSVVVHHYGRGRSLYCAGAVEENVSHDGVFVALLREVIGRQLSWRSDAPRPVEITVFRQDDRKRFIINLLNFQNELPNIPVQGVTVEIATDPGKVKSVTAVPEGRPVPFEAMSDGVRVTVDTIETFRMIAVELKQ